jgi:sugar transferase (PEP-CTERM/EpsH1 system associated)
MNSTSLRILFVTPYVPSTVRIRPLAFIRELARQGHQVTLACLVQPEWESAFLPEVSPYCQAVYPVYLKRFEPYLHTLASLPTSVPLSVAYCRSNEFNELIRRLIDQGNFDFVHTEFVRAAPATITIKGFPKLFDAVDSLSLAYRRSISAAQVPPKQRLVALVEWLKLHSYEPRILQSFDQVIVSSPADRQSLEKNGARVEVIPNGVDIEYFSFYAGPRDEATIVFLGKMSYYVNVASVMWFYRQVLPLIRRHHPEVKFKIVGRSPAPAISALASDPGIEVTGTVPDVRPYLAQARLSICPMVSGAGIQNKMLEAMAVGAPCVATSLACQALQTVPDQEVVVANSAEEFAAAVCELLDHPARRQQLAEQARRYIERCHVWSCIGESLHQTYRSLLAKEPHRSLSLDLQGGLQ